MRAKPAPSPESRSSLAHNLEAATEDECADLRRARNRVAAACRLATRIYRRAGLQCAECVALAVVRSATVARVSAAVGFGVVDFRARDRGARGRFSIARGSA